MTDGVDCLEVPLTRGFYALIDECDVDLILPHQWTAAPGRGTWYAVRRIDDGRRLFMHQALLDVPTVDHCNRNGLDNRRENLRPATERENKWNQKLRADSQWPYKGIRWRARRRPWVAFIQVEGKRLYLGSFALPEDAARAYDEAAIAHFGAFAATNYSLGLLDCEAGISLPPPDPASVRRVARAPIKSHRGERHHNAKVSDAQRDEIIRRYEAGGVRQSDLAEEFGLTQSRVSQIVRRWRKANIHPPASPEAGI